MNCGDGIFFVDKARLREKRLRPLVKWSGDLIRNTENNITSWKSEHTELILGSKERRDYLIRIVA